MTEKTVEFEKHPVPLLPFVLALIAAPLVTGLPAYAILAPFFYFDAFAAPLMLFAFIAAASVVGAPTYLLFGGPAFFMALRRAGPNAGTILPAIKANLISAPVVLLGYLFLEGADGGVLLPSLSFVMLGIPFSAAWGFIFSRVHNVLLQRFG